MDTQTTRKSAREASLGEYRIPDEPFYVALHNEIEIFEVDYQNDIPILLKGQTGCGKTRLLVHVAKLMSPSGIKVAHCLSRCCFGDFDR